MKYSDIFSDVTKTVMHALVSGRTSVAISSALDVRQYDGFGEVELFAEQATDGSSPTLNVKVQESATEGGSYTDVTDGAFTEVTDAAGGGLQRLKIDFNASKGFLKILPALAGGGTPTFTFGTAIRGRKKMTNTPSAQSL